MKQYKKKKTLALKDSTFLLEKHFIFVSKQLKAGEALFVCT